MLAQQVPFAEKLAKVPPHGASFVRGLYVGVYIGVNIDDGKENANYL